jgi:hypothetical protein
VAVALEFLDLLIPIVRIQESYPGGWQQCLADFDAAIGGRVWYDDHLFRDGAMDPAEMKRRVEGWAVLGFEVAGRRAAGRGPGAKPARYWKDVCVVDWAHGGATLPCDWLQIDLAARTAHLAGTDPGPLAWRQRPRAGHAR